MTVTQISLIILKFSIHDVYSKYTIKKPLILPKKNNLLSLAGSDAHFLNEIGEGGIITESIDLLETVIKGDFKIFGEKSFFINLLITEMLKLRRR